MKVALGSMQIECSPEEFQQIYPAISNGKAALESIAVAPPETKDAPSRSRNKTKSVYRAGTAAEKILEVMSKHPGKVWSAIDFLAKVPTSQHTITSTLTRLARDKAIQKVKRGHYSFLSLEEGEAETNSIQSIQRVSKEPSEEPSQKKVKEMWQHVKPLFEEGKPVSDTQLMKMFGNLDRKAVYNWIVQACKAGLVEGDPNYTGFFKIVTAELAEEVQEEKHGMTRELSAAEQEQLKEKIIQVMISESKVKPWTSSKIARQLNSPHHHYISRLLRELAEAGKIYVGHYGNGVNPKPSKIYYTLELGEPLNAQEEPTTITTEAQES